MRHARPEPSCGSRGLPPPHRRGARQHGRSPGGPSRHHRDRAPRYRRKSKRRARVRRRRRASGCWAHALQHHRAEDGAKGFRDVVSEVQGLGSATARAAQSARDTRDSYGPAASQSYPVADDARSLSQLEPEPEEEELTAAHFDARHARSREPSYHLDDDDHEGLAARTAPTTIRRGRRTSSSAAASALVSRDRQARGGADYFRRSAGNDIVAVAAYCRGLSCRHSYRIQTAKPAEPRNEFAAEILRTSAAGPEWSRLPGGRARKPSRCRRWRSASSFTKRIRTIRKASAMSVRLSGERKRFRPGPASPRSSRCARMWKFPNAGSR